MNRFKQYREQRQQNAPTSILTMGRVVDTNDPHQMGRLKIACPMWGDPAIPSAEDIGMIPWAQYVSPFGGSVDAITHGPEGEMNQGTTAYGMWNIPKLGASVIVMMLDGSPTHRLWLGCIYEHSTPHTMPHGRYIEEMGNVPVTTSENTINPLATNLYKGFGTDPAKYEWRSRAADYSVAAVDAATVSSVSELSNSTKPDDKDLEIEEGDGNTYTRRNGYAIRRENDQVENPNPFTGGESYSSQVYSWVTPGFHGISMDDRPENCRIRLRTVTGHQIIMDDTNERIYLSTNRGDNWLEMDSNGNVDIHSERRVSIHSASDMNFTAGGMFRVHASEGIQLRTDREIRAHSKEDIHVLTDQNIRIQSTVDTLMQSENMHVTTNADCLFSVGSNMNVDAATDVNLTAGSNHNFNASSNIMLTSGGTNETKAGGSIIETAPQIHMNGPGAGSAASASPATAPEGKFAYYPNRVPQHEPWGRIMIDPAMSDQDDATNDIDPTVNLEIEYDDANVGKVELGETITRGTHWHR